MTRSQRKPLPYITIDVRRICRETLRFERSEFGAYMQIIMTYAEEQSPPTEDRLPEITGLSADEWAASRDAIASLFVVKDGVWKSRWIDGEIRRFRATTARRQKGARKAVKTRRQAALDAGWTPKPRGSRAKNMPALAEWKELRRQVFERDGYVCVYCDKAVDAPHCDHVMPVSRGGSSELDNLATACPSCNWSKGSKTVDEWRAAR